MPSLFPEICVTNFSFFCDAKLVCIELWWKGFVDNTPIRIATQHGPHATYLFRIEMVQLSMRWSSYLAITSKYILLYAKHTDLWISSKHLVRAFFISCYQWRIGLAIEYCPSASMLKVASINMAQTYHSRARTLEQTGVSPI